MRITSAQLRRIIKEEVRLLRESAAHREISQEEVRRLFPGAIEKIEAEVDGDEDLVAFDTMPGGEKVPYLTFYEDGGRLLMSNYEIGWSGWSVWNELL